MLTIYKYPLEITDEQTIIMPPGATVIACQVQHDTPCLWAVIDTKKFNNDTRTFRTYGTGNPLPQNVGKYIDTYQIRGGTLVFHVFEVTPLFCSG